MHKIILFYIYFFQKNIYKNIHFIIIQKYTKYTKKKIIIYQYIIILNLKNEKFQMKLFLIYISISLVIL